jgi:2-polyprenyl-3-methyl-5-hydroxy-6-metoxy-1,4-benzoquinol methylase
MNSNRINTYFNKVSANYSDESDGFIWSFLRKPEKQAFLKSFLGTKINGSLLDIGAGTGFYTKDFLYSGLEITCLDSSEMMIRKLSELKINVLFGNVEEMNLQEHYDVILMLGVLEFLFLQHLFSALTRL